MLSVIDELKNIIIIGDRVLIQPKSDQEQTKSGLYLPPGVKEKEKIQTGYIIKTGPGIPIPSDGVDEDWKSEEDKMKFIPLQTQEGDLAVFLIAQAYEVRIKGEKYYIVPQRAILMLERDEGLFED